MAADWMKPGKKIGEWKPWEGGRARWDGARWTFYIWRAGCRRSTNQHTHGGALDHLRAFEAHPEAYSPSAAPRMLGRRPPLFLTSELAAEWLDWMAAPQRQGGKANSPGHLYNSKHYITKWRDRLQDRDLRTLDVAELRLPATEKALAHKLRAIKTFFSWLHRHRPVPAGEVGFSSSDGPDTAALLLPQAKGHKLHFLDAKKAKTRREKGAHALEGYLAIREAKRFKEPDKLPYRDALDLVFNMGWHTTELVRWLELGSVIESLPRGREFMIVEVDLENEQNKQRWRHAKAASVLWTVHKSGQEFRTPISARMLVVAERLREWHKQERLCKEGRKSERVPALPIRFLIKLVHDACDELGITPKFGPGHARAAHGVLLKRAGVSDAEINIAQGRAANSPLAASTYVDPGEQLAGVVLPAATLPAAPQKQMRAGARELAVPPGSQRRNRHTRSRPN
jgi:hypothetical protein